MSVVFSICPKKSLISCKIRNFALHIFYKWQSIFTTGLQKDVDTEAIRKINHLKKLIDILYNISILYNYIDIL